MIKCYAVQHSDQMVCEQCCQTWDVNDPYEPSCNPVDGVSDAKEALGMIDDLIAFIADKAGCSVDEVTWYSWPQVFGSTSGPRGGISGQAVTTFQVYAFTAHGSKESVRTKYCGGIWRHWNGEPLARF